MSDGIAKLPDADHVEGVVLTKGATPQTSRVEIQYRNARTGWCKVEMTLPNALYLLTLLEGMSQNHGYEKLRKGEK